MHRPTDARTRLKLSNLKCDVHLGLITRGGGCASPSAHSDVTYESPTLVHQRWKGWNVGLRWEYGHPSARLDAPYSQYDRSLSAPSACSYACLVFVAPICCYTQVDRPTTPACSSPTMNFPFELYLYLCEYRPRSRSRRSAVCPHPRSPSPAPRNRNTSDACQCDVPHSLHHRYRYLHPIARFGPCRTSENTLSRSLPGRGFVLDATFRMGDALVQCLSHSI
ncbi:hypothetical protein B0H14DRAFT_457351 [Mycena olivaceomarginata]|nr:hypothetical protein B0H14DRAFT_457351 [Mycena olivaceomarginata]